MGQDSGVRADMDVAHDRCGKPDGCPVADDHWRDDKIAMAAIVGTG